MLSCKYIYQGGTKMKKAYIFILLICCILFSLIGISACAVVRDGNPVIDNVYIVSNAQKYKRDEKIRISDSIDKLTASMAKNEGEGMQFILRFENDVQNVKVQMSDLISNNGDIICGSQLELFRQHYIYTTADSEEYKDRAGWYPDALIPLCYDDLNSVDIEAGQNQGFWITVTTRQDQTPGLYRGEVSVSFDGGSRVIPVEVEVWDFILPVSNSFSTDYGTWFSTSWSWMTQHNATDGEDYNKLHSDYIDFFLKYRIVSNDLPISQNQSPVEYVQAVEDYMVQHPMASNFSIYVAGDAKTGKVAPGTLDWLKQVGDILRDKNLLDKFVISPNYDEPGDAEPLNERIRATSMDVQSAVPEWKIKMTTAPRKSLSGYIDPWVGIWSSKTTMENYVEDRIELGEEVWWYGCVGPRYPFPTYHIPDALMSSRLVHWMQKDWQITGNLYWASAITTKLNAEGSAFDAYRDIWSDPNCAANVSPGDGFLVYVGCKNDGVINRNIPVPTLRLESIRDGAEDYEYLTLLQDQIEKKLTEWNITDITADEIMDTYYTPLYNSMGDFSHNPELMLKMRKRIAHDIMNPDTIVAVKSDISPNLINNRQICVYASPGAKVEIDGCLVNEQNMGLYSVYHMDFDMEKQTDYSEVSVKVDGEIFIRTLKSMSDYEYMELAGRKIRQNVTALDLQETVAQIRDIYETNMFKKIQESYTGSGLSGQLGGDDYGDAVVLNLSDDAVYAQELKKCIAADLANTIPLVIKNEAAYDRASIELLTLYVPSGATVSVNGKPATFIESTDKYSKYTFELACGNNQKVMYQVEVSYHEIKEQFGKVLVHEITMADPLINLQDDRLNAYFAEMPIEDYGAAATVTDGKMNVIFAEKAAGILFLDKQCFMPGLSFGQYNFVRMKITNTSGKIAQGFKLTFETPRDVVDSPTYIGSMESDESRIVYFEIPAITGTQLEKLQSIQLQADGGSFMIEDISLVNKVDVVM